MARPRRNAARASTPTPDHASEYTRKRPLSSRSNKSRKRVTTSPDSDSSLTSLSDSDDEPVTKRARGTKAVAPSVDVLDMEDNELFQSVLRSDGIEEASENWIVAYQGEPHESLAQLVTFLFRLCGCTATITSDEVQDSEHVDDVLERIQDEFAQHLHSQYPIVSRSKSLKNIRKHAALLIKKIFSDASEAELLSDEDFLDTWQQWLLAMSVSSLRSFRHTSSLVAMWTIGAFSHELEQVRENYDVAVRQRDAEAKRQSANRTRLVHTGHKMEQLDSLRESLDAHLDDYVKHVFSPRSRDFDALVRLDCVDQLGSWMKEFPTQYLQEYYLRHVGAALSDPDVTVRLHALRSIKNVLVPEHAIQLVSFSETHKSRMVDMALYDVDLGVRTTAFAVLESANELDMLSNDDRAALAVHIFDLESRIRAAAAAFLNGLLQNHVAAKMQDNTSDESIVRVHCLVKLLSHYTQQLNAGTDDLDSDKLSLIEPGLGRVSVAFEALWDTTDSLHAWKPYIDILILDEGDYELVADEEAVAVEILAMCVHLVKERTDPDSDETAWEECSVYLIHALPKLLAKFSADTPRISDLLFIIPSMKLDVYHETRNMDAFESLWEDLCGHFMRHVEPVLLQRAAEAIKLLALASMDTNTSNNRLLSLKETVLSLLQDTLHQRQLDTTVFSEDDVHNIQASLARLHALLKKMDVSTLLDDDLIWNQIKALSLRGRLNYPQECQFVALALETLSLYLMWRTKDALLNETKQMDRDDTLLSRRNAVLDVIHSFLDRTSRVQSSALHVALMLYTLFFSIPGKDNSRHYLYMTCPSHIQERCAALFATELHTLVSSYHEHNKSRPRKGTFIPLDSTLLASDLHLFTLAGVYAAAIRVGVLNVSYAAPMLSYYAYFSLDFDALCHELVAVMKDDALHSNRGWIVCETILETLKGSFSLFLLFNDDASEAHYISLSRQLANATMIRGPGFSVIQSVDPKAITTLHVAGVQQFISYLHEGTGNKGREPVFFKGMANLLATLLPADAMKIHTTMQQRFLATNIKPEQGAREWEPYFSYEKRLLNLAAKDADIVKEASHYANDSSTQLTMANST